MGKPLLVGSLNWRFLGDVRDKEVEDQIGTVGFCGCYLLDTLGEGVSEQVTVIPGGKRRLD